MSTDIKKFLDPISPEWARKIVRINRSNFAAIKKGFPARKLKLIGVTGSSGKSTTSMMIYHLLNNLGYNTGVISTVGARIGNKKVKTGLHVSTPDPEDMQDLLKYMVDKGAEYVVLEASSHGLAQGRFGNLKLDHCIVTNITSDHLDWHKTWENYANAKATIIKMTKKGGTVVLNRENKRGYDFLKNFIKDHTLKRNVITYSHNELTKIEESAGGISFEYNEQMYTIPIIGTYNIENALASINLLAELGISKQNIAKHFALFTGVVGRMQVMQIAPFTTIVNFAHNADSLKKSLQSVKKIKSTHGKIICIFGSAGLRDVQKRYDMGEISAKYADVTIITAEDPRTESLEEINSQIIEGAFRGGGKLIKRFESQREYSDFKISTLDVKKGSIFAFDYIGVENRYDAVEFATKIARKGDVVITEGKGHEESLCFGEIEYPFTDQGAVKRALGME